MTDLVATAGIVILLPLIAATAAWTARCFPALLNVIRLLALMAAVMRS